MKLCRCICPNPTFCLMRHGITHTLSDCLGGCTCRCHYDMDGTLILSRDWQENRIRVARTVRIPRDEILDPRIQALMPEEVQ